MKRLIRKKNLTKRRNDYISLDKIVKMMSCFDLDFCSCVRDASNSGTIRIVFRRRWSVRGAKVRRQAPRKEKAWQ